MVDISIVNGLINQLITGGAPPCMDTTGSDTNIEKALALRFR